MKRLFHNFWLKAASLGAAVCLSLIVNLFFSPNDSNNSILQFVVPVELKNVPEDMMIIWPPVRQAEVTLSGPSLFLSQISTPIFKISLPSGSGNRFLAHLKKEDLNLPPYVQVLNIKPPSIEFTLDRRIGREVQVVVPKIGALPEEYRLDQIRTEPSSVRIEGPENEVAGVSSIETVPLDLRDLREETSRDLDVRIPGAFSEVKPRQVHVTALVSLVMEEVSFSGVPVSVRGTEALAPGSTAIPSSGLVSIRLSGPRGQMQALRAKDVAAYVAVDNTLTESSVKKEIKLDVPARVSILSIEPSSTDVRLVGKEAAEFPAASRTASPKSTEKKTEKKQKK